MIIPTIAVITPAHPLKPGARPMISQFALFCRKIRTPHGIRLPIMSCQHYTRRCAACQTRRCSICGHTGNMQKSTLSGAFLPFRPGSRAELCEHGLADLVHVADDAVGAVVEDCRLGVGVHGDDHVRVRKARDVVDRARHTERQQQLRLDHGAGLPDDELERQHAAVERVQASLPPRRSARRR